MFLGTRMDLFRKLFNRKLPDGLLEISERVYAFDRCFSTDIWGEKEYKIYMERVVRKLRDHFPDVSFMVFNFREGEHQSQIASILSEHDMNVIDYPRQYEGCPLLATEMIHLFLKSCESWFSLGPQNMILMHSERGVLPVLVFMLAALLLYRKQSGEKKTLEMIYKQAPRELLHLMSPLNPLPSQLRYLPYVSGRNVDSEWPPSAKPCTLDCVILRFVPNMDGEGGCRPIFRIYGLDPFGGGDGTPKVLFSTPKNSKLIRYYKQVDSELVKIDTRCHVAGDVVLECISLDSVQERELMMFRIMFHTAFIRSNILVLNREEIDTLWNAKDQFQKDFRAEVIFSDLDEATSDISIDSLTIEEKDALPIVNLDKVQDVSSKVDHTNVANILQENLETGRPKGAKRAKVWKDGKVKEKPNLKTSEHIIASSTSDALGKQSVFSFQSSDEKSSRNKLEPQEIQVAPQKAAQHTPSAESPSDSSSIEGKTESQELQVAPHEAEHSKNYIKPSTEANPSIRNVKIQYGLPIDDFVNVQDVFSKVDYTNVANMLQENSETGRPKGAKRVKVSHDDEVKEKSNLLSSEHIITCPTSDALEKQSSVENSSRNEFQPQETQVAPSDSSSIEGKTESQELQVVAHEAEHSKNYIKPSEETNPSIRNVEVQKVEVFPPQPEHSTLSFSTVLDVNSTRKKTEPQELQVAVQQPAQPKIISQSPPPPPLPSVASSTICSISSSPQLRKSYVPQPSPPPPPSLATEGPSSNSSSHVPPPPAPCTKGLSKADDTSPQLHSVSNGSIPTIPRPPASPWKGRSISRIGPKILAQQRKTNLKPYHWLKLTKAMQGSLWAEAQKPEEASKAPEIDMVELESLFSTAAVNPGDSRRDGKSNRGAPRCGPEKVQLIELRRAYNCEIMLSKIKISLPELTSSVLTLDDAALDSDQVENLIKFCPTNEEAELLKGYNGDTDKLGKCEQLFLELIKVPRIESKLRVLLFKIQFFSLVSDLRNSLNIVNSAAEEVRNSVKLKRVMQTILSLGNALNRGTARGSAVGFRLDSLLKLSETRSRDNKMTLMHYLCKMLDEKTPELLYFPQDLESLEASTKIQLKFLAEEMQAISKGLEKVLQELAASENDGPVSETFCLKSKKFLGCAESEVRSLALLYSSVGRNADALSLYFGEDPARCTFEQVVSTLLSFVRMFVRAHQENRKQIELESRKLIKQTMRS